MAAPYRVNISGTDDETFEWSQEWVQDDGTAFPFEDYTIEYVVAYDKGGEVMFLTSDGPAGVTVDAPNVTFGGVGYALEEGHYRHGCRIVDVDGKTIQVFDGEVTIDDGGFSSRALSGEY
jgi:hypothetical protein